MSVWVVIVLRIAMIVSKRFLSFTGGGTNVFRFRAVWLSGVVSLFRSAMGVAIRFLFRCGVAVLG